ncbi:MAG: hypothetical protein F6K24_36580 [Okeania sp. SIO2D1]|nr:hypothetical protein [Okeania sp. SIO2D1]
MVFALPISRVWCVSPGYVELRYSHPKRSVSGDWCLIYLLSNSYIDFRYSHRQRSLSGDRCLIYLLSNSYIDLYTVIRSVR